MNVSAEFLPILPPKDHVYQSTHWSSPHQSQNVMEAPRNIERPSLPCQGWTHDTLGSNFSFLPYWAGPDSARIRNGGGFSAVATTLPSKEMKPSHGCASKSGPLRSASEPTLCPPVPFRSSSSRYLIQASAPQIARCRVSVSTEASEGLPYQIANQSHKSRRDGHPNLSLDCTFDDGFPSMESERLSPTLSIETQSIRDSRQFVGKCNVHVAASHVGAAYPESFLPHSQTDGGRGTRRQSSGAHESNPRCDRAQRTRVALTRPTSRPGPDAPVAIDETDSDDMGNSWVGRGKTRGEAVGPEWSAEARTCKAGSRVYLEIEAGESNSAEDDVQTHRSSWQQAAGGPRDNIGESSSSNTSTPCLCSALSLTPSSSAQTGTGATATPESAFAQPASACWGNIQEDSGSSQDSCLDPYGMHALALSSRMPRSAPLGGEVASPFRFPKVPVRSHDHSLTCDSRKRAAVYSRRQHCISIRVTDEHNTETTADVG